MKYPEDFINKIIRGDCLEVMKEMPSECIDLVVTSPPYDNLRDYKGYCFDFERTAKDMFRILKQGGVLVWVVGDATVSGSETLTSFKQAISFREIGFNLHDTMIYQKDGLSFPETTRYYPSFEYMFILSKGKPKSINLLRDKKNKWGGAKVKGHQREKNGELKQRSRHGEMLHDYGIRTNVWIYGTGWNKTTKDEIAFKHPAMFPERLAADHILSWSNEDDTVMDPFSGSGTTAKMAKDLGRNFIGIEISDEYCAIAEERLRILDMQPKLF
jgi:site-specific DNA-methyltransferase (adenine-specific)